MLAALNSLIGIYLVAPIIVVIATSFTTTEYPIFPPRGLTLHWFRVVLTNSDFLGGARVSLLLGLLASGVATLLGAGAALGLSRGVFRHKSELAALFLSPIFFPPIVLGLALLIYFHDIGLVGTIWGMAAGHVVLITPFVLRLTAASLGEFDDSLEEAALNLGASYKRVFFRITVPLILPGIVAGAILAFVISFDELVVSLFLSGPGLQTLPIRIFTYIEYSSTPAISAISTILLAIWMLVGVPVYVRFLGIRGPG